MALLQLLQCLVCHLNLRRIQSHYLIIALEQRRLLQSTPQNSSSDFAIV